MQITITQTEIEEAIDQYIRKRVRMAEFTPLAVDLKASRGSDGFTATIDLVDDQEAELKEREIARKEESKSRESARVSSFVNKVTGKDSEEETESENGESLSPEPVEEEEIEEPVAEESPVEEDEAPWEGEEKPADEPAAKSAPVFKPSARGKVVRKDDKEEKANPEKSSIFQAMRR